MERKVHSSSPTSRTLFIKTNMHQPAKEGFYITHYACATHDPLQLLLLSHVAFDLHVVQTQALMSATVAFLFDL